MKKTILIICLTLLLATTVEANTLYTDQDHYETDKNDTFTVTLYTNLTTDSYGLFLYELAWDQTIVQATTVTNLAEWELAYSYGGGLEPGKLTLVNWWKMGHNETGIIPILEIEFKALAKGTTSLNFIATTTLYSHTFNKEADIFELECTNATITVNDDSGNGGNGNGGNGGYTPPTPPINQKPVAIINYGYWTNITEGIFTNETIGFTANQSYDNDGTITDYLWQFGDDATSTNITTTHSYAKPDVYPVTLTVTDNNGATDTTTEYITVLDLPINDTEPPDNTTDKPDPTDNQTDDLIIEPNNNTNITKEDDGFKEIIIAIFVVVLIACVVFIYMYRKRRY